MGLFKLFSGEDNSKMQGQIESQTPIDDDDDELIAVITAAIAAYESNQTASSLVVQKINRTSGPVVAWNTAGRTELIDSRRI